MLGFPQDTLILPAYSGVVSAVLLAVNGIKLSKSTPLYTSSVHVGKAAFAWKILRLIGCLALLGLSVASLVLDLRADKVSYTRVSLCITFVSGSVYVILNPKNP